MPVNKRYCLKGKSISDGSALDPMGLKPIDTLWSLHNIVFFFASTLHLDKSFKFLDISAQEMFMKVSLEFLRKKIQKSNSKNQTRIIVSAVQQLYHYLLRICWWAVVWFKARQQQP